MTSQILDIFASIAAMTVTINTTNNSVDLTPRVYGIGEIQNTVAASNLPARVITPMSSMNDDIRQSMFVALGSTTQVEWTVLDLLLWRPVKQGEGFYTVAPQLIEYAGAYMVAAKALRGLGVTQAHWKQLIANIGVYPYPLDGRMEAVPFYAGVACIWTIREALFG